MSGRKIKAQKNSAKRKAIKAAKLAKANHNWLGVLEFAQKYPATRAAAKLAKVKRV